MEYWETQANDLHQCRFCEGGQRGTRPDPVVKSLEGEIMLSDDVLRLHEGGQRCACPYPAFKQGWIAAELIRLERFVLCAPTVLQAGPGAGGQRPWAVSRSDKNRLASIRVAIFRAAVARATRSTGRDGGRRCSIVRFVN